MKLSEITGDIENPVLFIFVCFLIGAAAGEVAWLMLFR